MKKKKKVKRVINKQKIFCFISLIFIIICIFWYGGRAIYFYLDTRKVVENVDKLLAQSIIDKNYDTNNFKKINNDYYFYNDAKTNYLLYSNILFTIVKINKDNHITLITDNEIASLAYGSKVDYKKSYIYNWLNKTDNEYSGILENNLNEKEKYLIKNKTCIDNITNIKKITCEKTDNSSYLSLLSLIDYINTGSDESFINNEKYTYLSNKNNDEIWYINTSGKLNTSDGTDIYGIKPTITIKPTISLISGDGSKENPYTIEENNSYFASYVKLDQDIWRIYETNENKLKLVLNDYIKVDNETLKHNYSNKNYYHNDTKYGTLAYYLNKDYLNSLSYKDLILENKYSNYFYGTDNNFNYEEVIKNTIDTKISIPSINDPILTNNLDSYFINTGINKESSMMYLRNNTSTLSTTRVTRENNIIPCITIDKTILKQGTGSIEDPYRTE